VHFAAAGALHECRHIVVANARAGHHDDAVASARDELAQALGSGWGRCGLPRTQHARDAEADEGFERRIGIRAQIEGAVARDGQRARNRAQLRKPGLVELAVGGEDPGDEARGAGLPQRFGVAAHDRELLVVVEEIPAARPQHRKHGNRHGGLHGLQHAEARGEAPFEQGAAQFEPAGARGGGGAGAGNRVDGNFNEDLGYDSAWHADYGAYMRAQLLHLSGPDRGRTVTYDLPVVTIGSSPSSEALIYDPGVQPNHARIEWVEHQCAFHLRAVEGRVFVNGNEVEEIILQDEDQIEFGLDGPMARFHIYVPIGAVCKPVRKMLDDARAVGRVSGGAAATRSFTRDLFTQATMKLKVGFPAAVLGVVGAAFLAGWLGGWLGSRPSEAERRRTADSVTHAELEELRALQHQQRDALVKIAQANAVVRRIQQEWSRGVCLMHGVFRIRMPDQAWLIINGTEPFEVEYTGSGFLVSAQGHIVTNSHVVAPWVEMEGLGPLLKSGATPEFVRFSATFPGRAPIDVPIPGIRRRTDDLDVAVVKVDPALVVDVPVLPLQVAGPDPEDQRAIVVGYPTGLAALLARADNQLVDTLRQQQASMTKAIEELAATGQISPMITQGVISNVQERMLVYDAPTTHGGSGGPVFNGSGEVIAVNYAILPDFGGANFGVPIRFARELLPQ
jgi:serine protease Do